MSSAVASRWRHLTADELVEGGRAVGIGPVRSVEALEACVGSPAATFDGADLYPEVFDKAAIVAFNIVKTYHPFIDGNKRCAAIALLGTCLLNGYRAVLTQAELVAVIRLVAEGRVDQEGLVSYLRNRVELVP